MVAVVVIVAVVVFDDVNADPVEFSNDFWVESEKRAKSKCKFSQVNMSKKNLVCFCLLIQFKPMEKVKMCNFCWGILQILITNNITNNHT